MTAAEAADVVEALLPSGADDPILRALVSSLRMSGDRPVAVRVRRFPGGSVDVAVFSDMTDFDLAWQGHP